MISFLDEDWTGLTHRQIWSQIVAEEEEQQCKAEGHQYYPVFICRNCGETFNIGECTMTKNRRTKG